MKHLLSWLLLTLLTGCYQMTESKENETDTGGADVDADGDTNSDSETETETESRCDEVICSGSYFITFAYDLSKIQNCTTILGDVIVSQLHSGSPDNLATSLAVLGCLERIEGDLSFENLKTIENLHGLENLNHVGGNVQIGMAFIEGEHGGIIGYSIGRNRSLLDLSGLEGLVRVEGGMIIGENPQLTSLEELSSLSKIDGDLIIRDNERLPTCEAMRLRDQLQTIGKESDIVNNLEDNCSDD
ncbi:MAG: hypothetical protein GY854_31280 [Deltaproteobacteria bacterium]|nr:hypothetical protein [Deltaproteobacteria bacterium]